MPSNIILVHSLWLLTKSFPIKSTETLDLPHRQPHLPNGITRIWTYPRRRSQIHFLIGTGGVASRFLVLICISEARMSVDHFSDKKSVQGIDKECEAC